MDGRQVTIQVISAKTADKVRKEIGKLPHDDYKDLVEAFDAERTDFTPQVLKQIANGQAWGVELEALRTEFEAKVAEITALHEVVKAGEARIAELEAELAQIKGNVPLAG